MMPVNTKGNPHHAKKAVTKVNVWQNVHNSLPDAKKTAARNQIMKMCQWSQNTFYKKMREPETLREIEKPVIAKAYHKSVATLFPEPQLIRA